MNTTEYHIFELEGSIAKILKEIKHIAHNNLKDSNGRYIIEQNDLKEATKIFLYFKEVIKPFKDRHVRKVDKKLQEELFDEIRKYLNLEGKENEKD